MEVSFDFFLSSSKLISSSLSKGRLGTLFLGLIKSGFTGHFMALCPDPWQRKHFWLSYQVFTLFCRCSSWGLRSSWPPVPYWREPFLQFCFWVKWDLRYPCFFCVLDVGEVNEGKVLPGLLCLDDNLVDGPMHWKQVVKPLLNLLIGQLHKELSTNVQMLETCRMFPDGGSYGEFCSNSWLWKPGPDWFKLDFAVCTGDALMLLNFYISAFLFVFKRKDSINCLFIIPIYSIFKSQ